MIFIVLITSLMEPILLFLFINDTQILLRVTLHTNNFQRQILRISSIPRVVFKA